MNKVNNRLKRSFLYGVCLASLSFSISSFATGMVPETSVLLVDESKGEASLNVKNTDPQPALLYTRVLDVEGEDKSIALVVTQPVVRLEAGKSQRVRFILQTKAPLAVEHLKRVTFEGIPPKEKGKNQVAMTIRQNIPVIIHPAGLAEDIEPWKRLQWHKKGAQLVVENPSPYIVRLGQQVQGMPGNIVGQLPKTWIQPGEKLTVAVTENASLSSAKQITFFPASRYGYQGKSYTSDLAD